MRKLSSEGDPHSGGRKKKKKGEIYKANHLMAGPDFTLIGPAPKKVQEATAKEGQTREKKLTEKRKRRAPPRKNGARRCSTLPRPRSPGRKSYA